MVGARGFEPPTTGTPCRCATRLRYAPKKEYIGKIGGWNRSRTGVHGFAGRCMTTLPSSLNGLQCKKNGAGNEIRTRDPDLGKVVLYQLSYSRALIYCPLKGLQLIPFDDFTHLPDWPPKEALILMPKLCKSSGNHRKSYVFV